MRCFFDLTRAEHSLFDYKGDEFTSLNAALDFAKTTAQRLENNLSGEWSGWVLEVRCPEGKKYFSVPIRNSNRLVPKAKQSPQLDGSGPPLSGVVS
jgi:hypothetical protein